MGEKVLLHSYILSDIAEAIRDKYGSDETIKPIEMAQWIRDLETKEKNYRYYSSWRGLITPLNSVYQQAYYNNGIVIGDKIYFQRSASHHSHWNADSHPTTDRFFCYDTTNNSLTSKPCLYNDQPFHMSSLWEKDGAIYGFGYPYRYKTSDLGETWTREEMTTPQYDPCPVFKLKSGRIIGTMLAKTKYLMITDDNGLTWRTISPFANNSDVATMSHGTICELDDCLVLYFNRSLPMTSDAAVRCVSVSYDNGDTWSTPNACADDLGVGGCGIAPGGFGYLGNKWHFVVGNRYTQKGSDISGRVTAGDLRWYIGDADDVKNGTMTLKKVLDETIVQDNARQMSREDTGNGGVVFCNGALYCNWGNLIYNHSISNDYLSNQGIEMYRLSTAEESDADGYWDANYLDKFTAIQTTKSHAHNYYFYSPSDTNLPQSEWFGYDDGFTGYLPNVGKFALPMGTGDFEVNAIVKGNVQEVGLTASWPRILAGIELSNGEFHAVGGTGSKNGGLDRTSDSVPAGTLPWSGKTCVTFKRTGNDLAITVNGVTVTNPVFGWENNKSTMLQNVAVDSFVFNINATDENAQAFVTSEPQTWNMGGIIALTIDCNSAYPEKPTYTITNNLTNCTTNNDAETAKEGTAYTATITPNSGTENFSVSCTMGGVAQTVTNGVINIAEVTGNIVITATANEILYLYAPASASIALPITTTDKPKISAWIYYKGGAESGSYHSIMSLGGSVSASVGVGVKGTTQPYYFPRSWANAPLLSCAIPLEYFEVDYPNKTVRVKNTSGTDVNAVWSGTETQNLAFRPVLNTDRYWYRILVEINGETAYDFKAALDDNDVPCLKDVLTGTCYYDEGHTALLGVPN